MLGDSMAVASGAAVGLLCWSFAKLYVGPRFYSIELQPRLSPTLRGFVVGHMVDDVDKLYGRGITLTDCAWTKNKDKAAAIRLFNQGFILSANPADLEWVLNGNAQNYCKSATYNILTRFLGKGLVTLFNPETHAVHRKEVSPAFAPAALKEIADFCFPEHALALVTALRARAAAGVPFAGKDEIAVAALNIMAQAAFKCSDDQTLETVRTAFVKSLKAGWSFLRLSAVVDKALILSNLEVARNKATMGGIVEKISKSVLHDTATENGAASNGRKTLIDYLLQSSKLNSAEITDHSITFLFAGFDTTSNALNWFTYQMAKHPDCQERLYEELSAVVGLNSVPSVEDLRGCRYLFNVLRENLRRINPVGGMPRDAIRDDVLPGTKQFVPAGHTVYLCMHAMHVHPAIWGPDADSFVPERWERPETEAIAEKAFIPFSVGRRNCIGKDFAMNEMKVLAATIVRNFKLAWPDGELEPTTGDDPIVQPQEPIRLLWTARTQ